MAKTTSSSVTFESVMKDIKAKSFKPVYYLMGEESYYIDRISDYIVEQALRPEERDFSLCTLFGADVSASDIISMAKSFPMGGERQVVLVREAQNVADMEQLVFYLQNPQLSTILILCHKNGSLDRRKKLSALVERVGILFESKKPNDRQLLSFVSGYLKQKGVGIDAKASEMIVDFVGADMSRMSGELDKLIIALEGNPQKLVTSDVVEKNIGISKEYNNFELQSALVEKDILKANLIVIYFDKNQKTNPIQMTLSLLFKFYSNLMLAYYAPNKTPTGIASWLGISPWQAEKNVIPAMRMYSGTKVMQIISQIRRADGLSKGVGGGNVTNGELLRELIFFILH